MHYHIRGIKNLANVEIFAFVSVKISENIDYSQMGNIFRHKFPIYHSKNDIKTFASLQEVFSINDDTLNNHRYYVWDLEYFKTIIFYLLEQPVAILNSLVNSEKSNLIFAYNKFAFISLITFNSLNYFVDELGAFFELNNYEEDIIIYNVLCYYVYLEEVFFPGFKLINGTVFIGGQLQRFLSFLRLYKVLPLSLEQYFQKINAYVHVAKIKRVKLNVDLDAIITPKRLTKNLSFSEYQLLMYSVLLKKEDRIQKTYNCYYLTYLKNTFSKNVFEGILNDTRNDTKNTSLNLNDVFPREFLFSEVFKNIKK